MAILKCKMCGGDLQLVTDSSTAECEYCGTMQTVPTVDNEKKLALFARGNRLRLACEFDRASGVYESIVAEFPEEAEAYWGLILCKYGIEYVDDPKTEKKIPTCHRSSFDCVLDDNNYEMVMEYADGIARKVYREEAKAIEELRKGIVEVSSKEEPYDIFICYKETAEDGQRTLDSVLAQDIYNTLTEKGYRVFFSRVTLEDKLGQEYEPYIFAALSSTKIMLAVGTDYEHYNAVWVKNEWSRYLQLIASGQKKYLIPCFKGIDAYDMPREFAKLQAQDLGKIGAMQDLVRGIEKILPRNICDEQAVQVATIPQGIAVPNTAPLLRRGQLYLEDSEWDNATKYFDKVLDMNPDCAEAYIGKLCAELKVLSKEALANLTEPFDNRKDYKKAIRFADAALRKELSGYVTTIVSRNNENAYQIAMKILEGAKYAKEYKQAAEAFEICKDYRDASVQQEMCHRKALELAQHAEAEQKKLAQQIEQKEREINQHSTQYSREIGDLRAHINEIHIHFRRLPLYRTKKREELLQQARILEEGASALEEEKECVLTKLQDALSQLRSQREKYILDLLQM